MTRIRSSLTEQITIPALVGLPYKLQTYFMHVMPPLSFTAADGTFLGHLIVDTAEAAKKPERASAVRTFVECTAILRESGVGCLDALLTARLGASGHDVLPQAVETFAPRALTMVEAIASAVVSMPSFASVLRRPMRSVSCFESTRQ